MSRVTSRPCIFFSEALTVCMRSSNISGTSRVPAIARWRPLDFVKAQGCMVGVQQRKRKKKANLMFYFYSCLSFLLAFFLICRPLRVPSFFLSSGACCLCRFLVANLTSNRSYPLFSPMPCIVFVFRKSSMLSRFSLSPTLPSSPAFSVFVIFVTPCPAPRDLLYASVFELALLSNPDLVISPWVQFRINFASCVVPNCFTSRSW